MWRVTIPQCPTVVGGCNCPSLAEFTITAGFIRGCRTSRTGQWEQSESSALFCAGASRAPGPGPRQTGRVPGQTGQVQAGLWKPTALWWMELGGSGGP